MKWCAAAVVTYFTLICKPTGLGLQALHVCIALLDRQRPEPAPGQPLRQSVERAAAAAAELDSKLEMETIEGVCQHAHRLAALLDVAPSVSELVSFSD